MFPRYLFLRPTRPEQSLATVRSTIGVSRLVMFGEQPAPLAGVQALVQAVSKDRVTLLLHILGRPQAIQVEFGQIQPL